MIIIVWVAAVNPQRGAALMQAALSFRPLLLLWTGLCGAAAWTLGFVCRHAAGHAARAREGTTTRARAGRGPHVLRGRDTPIERWAEEAAT